jgi:hypothetical protein
MFSTDRFFSLTLGTSYAVAEDDCNMQSGEGSPRDPAFNHQMHHLTSLVEKVIDHTKAPRSVPYWSILAIDIDLEHFGSQLPKDPWTFPPAPSPHRKPPFKGPEMGIIVLVFFQARLSLHLSWMLGSLSDSGLDYSRSGCFESARTIVRMFNATRGANSRFPVNKCAPIDLVAFVAAAVLCLGQFGYAPGSDDANRLEEDEEMVKSAMEVFGRLRNDIARQSISNLKQLVDLQDKWDSGQEVPSSISIPFLGSVTIPDRALDSFGHHFSADAVASTTPGQAEFNNQIEPAMSRRVTHSTPAPTRGEAAPDNSLQPDAISYTMPFDLDSFPFVSQNREGEIMPTQQAFTVWVHLEPMCREGY